MPGRLLLAGWVPGALFLAGLLLSPVPTLGAAEAEGDEAARALTEAGLPEQPTLQDYLDYALERNPGLEGARRVAAAASHRADRTGVFPEPRLTYGYYAREVETRAGPMEHQVSLSQRIPWFGLLGARHRQAGFEAEAEQARLLDRQNSLRTAVQEAYYEYAYLAQAMLVARENADLLASLEGVVRERYTSGAASHSSLMRVQVELGRMEDRLNGLEALRAPASSRLAALLDLPSGFPVLPWPGEIPRPALPADADTLEALLPDSNPDLRALEHSVQGANQGVKASGALAYPDITVGVGYTFIGSGMAGDPDSGQDPILVTLALDLPIRRGAYRAAREEAEARLDAARLERRETANRLVQEMRMLLYQAEDTDRRVRLYEQNLLPRARQSLAVARQGYEAGAAGFNDLIDAQRTLLEFELALERSLADRGIFLAHLESLFAEESPWQP